VNKPNKRSGMAIVTVLILSMALLIFVSTLLTRTGHQRATHGLIVDQAKAIMAARAAMQLALYKLRVLPTEFYQYDVQQKAYEINPSDPPASYSLYSDVWLKDLISTNKDSPAEKIAKTLNQVDVTGVYEIGVNKFRLISKTDRGYVKDYVQIEAYGTYNKQTKLIEELVEVEITH